MWKQSENIVHRLFSRQVSRGPPNTHVNEGGFSFIQTDSHCKICSCRNPHLKLAIRKSHCKRIAHIHRARELYENVVPSHTVYDVDCPDQWWRRFTNDGQYLICFSRTYQEVLIYRPLWLSYCSTSETTADEPPAKSKKFDSYFSLLHQIPLTTGANEVICKDFFLSTENNLYGIFATSTAPDNNPPATNGAVAGVPCIEKITFFVVRLADGVITGRSVFQDDYIHLAHNAGVFLHDDLLAILSIRFQRIHILQVRDGGLFLDVRTIGDFCREDDELLLNSQSQEEAKFQELQATLRKARVLVPEAAETPMPVSQPTKTWGVKPWTNLSGRRRPRPWDARPAPDDPGTSGAAASRSYSQSSTEIYGGRHGDNIDLYDGYFRGLFTGADGSASDMNMPNGNGSIRIRTEGDHRSYENVHVRRFVEGHHGSHNTVAGRVGLGGDYGSYENSSEHHPGIGVENGSNDNGSGRRVFTGREYASYENLGGRRFETSVSTSGSLYSSSGSDTVSHSYNTTTDPGSSDATTLHDFSGHNEDPGPRERQTRPVPSMSVSGRSMGAPHNRAGSVFPDESTLPGPSAGLSRSTVEGGDQGATSTGIFTGRPRRPGLGNTVLSQALPGFGSGRGGSTQSGSAGGASMPDDVPPQGSQILGGLKQCLLSFILQGIQADDTSPAIKAQRLKRFYYHFQDYVDLVMWKVQFLDRYHLLIKFGSVDGVVLRNSEASHQTAFLAIYNLETTQMLGFYQNSSEELLQLVERYCDHFRVAPQYPSNMNFISSYANNSFAREQLRKQKAACITSKAGSYSQVVKRTLAILPYNSQCQSPSAYFDQYLFHYDEKLISATDRHKPCMEHPIKFISRRRPNTLKFKINPGLELGSNDGHVKRVASFLFHPILPFAISVQQSFMQTTIVNFHFRR